MRVFLLTRESPCQRYCANTLFSKGILTDVIVEEGSSLGENSLIKRILAKGNLLMRPANVFWSFWNYCHEKQYYGHQESLERKIMGSPCKNFEGGLRIFRTSDINSKDAQQYLKDNAPDFIFVFGTRIIKPWIFDTAKAPVINMHWGWSPDFRGEGIISALALRGVEGLGVTVHRLTSVADGGEIIRQERPAIDRSDNFYSIGLKLAQSGTRLFGEIFRKFLSSGELKGSPQDLSTGRFYSVKFMRANPQLKSRAWRNLKAGFNGSTRFARSPLGE